MGDGTRDAQGNIADGDVDGVQCREQQQRQVLAVRQASKCEGSAVVKEHATETATRRMDACEKVRERKLHY